MSNLKIEALKLRSYDSPGRVTEELPVVEQRFYVSTGFYRENNDLHYSAQDPNLLTGTSLIADISDPLEYSGIAEFWQPGAASLDEEVRTRGKIRRHWADRFDSWDVDRYFRGGDGGNSGSRSYSIC